MTDLLLAVDDGSRNPGPIPLFIVLILGIAVFLLIRNMNGRIKRLPPSFDDVPKERPERPEQPDEPERQA